MNYRKQTSLCLFLKLPSKYYKMSDDQFLCICNIWKTYYISPDCYFTWHRYLKEKTVTFTEVCRISLKESLQVNKIGEWKMFTEPKWTSATFFTLRADTLKVDSHYTARQRHVTDRQIIIQYFLNTHIHT